MGKLTAEQRFWAKVNKDGPVSTHRPDLGPCWIWTASRRHDYGAFSLGGRAGRVEQAHRVAYIWLRGPIPEGYDIDHLCRVPACVNPSHLEPVTHRINCLRGTGASARCAAVTHCPRGHEYTPENTYVTNKGGRICRICTLRQVAERSRRLRAAR